MNITEADFKLVDIAAEEGSIDAIASRIIIVFGKEEEPMDEQTAKDMAHRAVEVMGRITPSEVWEQGFAAACSYHRYLRIERKSIETGDSELALKCRKEMDRLRMSAS